MTQAESEIISLFPLANVALFPTLTVPLYIFEPRYRQMLEHTHSTGQPIGMVAVRPDAVGEIRGDPALFAIGCAGEISQSRQRPDGSWDILLHATARFRIIEEQPRRTGQLYRSARVEMLEDPCTDEDRTAITKLRERALALLTDMLRSADPKTSAPPSDDSLSRIEDQRLINLLSQGLDFGVLERQRLLEADGIANRYDVLCELMRFRIAERDALAGSGTGVLH
jgi:Lon protease-like protein